MTKKSPSNNEYKLKYRMLLKAHLDDASEKIKLMELSANNNDFSTLRKEKYVKL